MRAIDDVIELFTKEELDHLVDGVLTDKAAKSLAKVLSEEPETVIKGMGKTTDDLDNLRMNIFSSLGIDHQFTEAELKEKDNVTLTKILFDQAYKSYTRKNNIILERAIPILKDVQKNRGATVKEIMVPISDGIKQIGVVINLESTINNEGRDLIRAIEKTVTLAIIDQNWKEHLRDMDDLKQSVQNAVYEQKDPLLIYKFEAFEMFKRFLGKLNDDIVSFISKSDLPKQDPDQVKVAQSQQGSEPRVTASKEEAGNTLGNQSGQRAAIANSRPAVSKDPVKPRKSDKVYGRNDRVTVKYTNGNMKKDVKYKSVEEDISDAKCVIIED